MAKQDLPAMLQDIQRSLTEKDKGIHRMDMVCGTSGKAFSMDIVHRCSLSQSTLQHRSRNKLEMSSITGFTQTVGNPYLSDVVSIACSVFSPVCVYRAKTAKGKLGLWIHGIDVSVFITSDKSI